MEQQFYENQSKEKQGLLSKQFNWLSLISDLWEKRKFILKSVCFAVVLGLIIAFSIPREYTTTVKLSPEIVGENNRMGGLNALAGMAGINLGGQNGRDALSPQLYPDIVHSVQFITDLFEIPVAYPQKKEQISVYDYLLNYQQSTWWSLIIKIPLDGIKWCLSLFQEEDKIVSASSTKNQGSYYLSLEETAIAKALKQRIGVVVDNKTSVITLSVTMQSPEISASITDSVMLRLQDYITAYRTTKARHDLGNTQIMFNEAKLNYYKAQQKYANYLDKNQNLSLQIFQTERERLQNEASLSFNLYNQMAQQLQMAKLKVQANTPVFTVVEAGSVPLKPNKPSKKMIVVGFAILGFTLSGLWIINKENILRFWEIFNNKKNKV